MPPEGAPEGPGGGSAGWGGVGSEEGQALSGFLSCRTGCGETRFRGAASLASCLVTPPVQTCWRRPVTGENGTRTSGGSCVRHQQTPGTRRCLAKPASRPGQGWPAGHGCWQRPGTATRSLGRRPGSHSHGDGQSLTPAWGQRRGPGCSGRVGTHVHTQVHGRADTRAHTHTCSLTHPACIRVLTGLGSLSLPSGRPQPTRPGEVDRHLHRDGDNAPCCWQGRPGSCGNETPRKQNRVAVQLHVPGSLCSRRTESQSFGVMTTFRPVWQKRASTLGRAQAPPVFEGSFRWEAGSEAAAWETGRACRWTTGLAPSSYGSPSCQVPPASPE